MTLAELVQTVLLDAAASIDYWARPAAFVIGGALVLGLYWAKR